jgi:hypothetical protein
MGPALAVIDSVSTAGLEDGSITRTAWKRPAVPITNAKRFSLKRSLNATIRKDSDEMCNLWD